MNWWMHNSLEELIPWLPWLKCSDAVYHGPNDVSNNNKRTTLYMWVFVLYQQHALSHNSMEKKYIQVCFLCSRTPRLKFLPPGQPGLWLAWPAVHVPLARISVWGLGHQGPRVRVMTWMNENLREHVAECMWNLDLQLTLKYSEELIKPNRAVTLIDGSNILVCLFDHTLVFLFLGSLNHKYHGT